MADKNRNQYWVIDSFAGISPETRQGVPGAALMVAGIDIARDSGAMYLSKKPERITLSAPLTERITTIAPSTTLTAYTEKQKILLDGTVSSLPFQPNPSPPPTHYDFARNNVVRFMGETYYPSFIYFGTEADPDKFTVFTDITEVGIMSFYWDTYETLDPLHYLRWMPAVTVGEAMYMAGFNRIWMVNDAGVLFPDHWAIHSDYRIVKMFPIGWDLIGIIGVNTDDRTSRTAQSLFYVWDGLAQEPELVIDIPSRVHTGISHDGRIFLVAGDQLSLLEIQNSSVRLIQSILKPGESGSVFPNAITAFNDHIHVGVSNISSGKPNGVYAYGTPTVQRPETLSMPFIPTGFSLDKDENTEYNITALGAAGDTLLVGYDIHDLVADTQDFYLDKFQLVDGGYALEGKWRSLIFDGQSPFYKRISRINVELTNELQPGQSVTIAVNTDPYEDVDWQNNNASRTVARALLADPTTKVITFDGRSSAIPMRSREFQLEITLTNTEGQEAELGVKRIIVEYAEEADVL